MREKDGESFRNSPTSERWLVSGPQETLANFVAFNYDMWAWVGQLEDYIKSGQAQDIHTRPDAGYWRSYMMGLRDIASLSADGVVRRMPWGTHQPTGRSGLPHLFFSCTYSAEISAMIESFLTSLASS